MVSLLKLAQVTEEGVRFHSPHDGTPMYAPGTSPVWTERLTKQLQASDTGALDISPELNRLRHHHAT